MFTDMVGFTSLTQKNEPLTLELLEEHRKLLRPLFPKYAGKEIKTEGDKFLVEFASALDAVTCALDIQRTLHESNSARPPEKRVILRIGVHLGDIIHTKDRDVYGDAVNVASRIEPLADPGGVCISDSVYAQIKNKVEYPVVKMGSRQLKNVQEPMEVYKVELPWGVEKVPPQIIQSDRNRLVVLPFKSMSPDPNDEYFADGMTEELITALSGIKDLDVIARTTAMLYKGVPKRVSEIGKELNSNSLIEGSVRKAGDKVRITVQLIGTKDEAHIWAQNYDKQLDDIFAVQSDIAERVAGALKVKLLPSEKQELEKPLAQNLDAYTLYLKGRYHWGKRSKEEMMQAVGCYTQAVGLDPSFALGYSGLADCYCVMYVMGFGDRTSNFEKAYNYAMKALEVDDKLAEAHTSLALIIAFRNYDFTGAEKEFKKAIELKPSYAEAHEWYSSLLGFQGRAEEAYVEIRRALELDPLSVKINLDFVQFLDMIRRDYDQAIEQCKKVLKVAPEFWLARMTLVRLFCHKQMYNEALKEVEAISTMAPEDPLTKYLRAYAYAYTGKKQEAQSQLAGMGESEQAIIGSFGAAIYFVANDYEKGFELLERAVNNHDPAFLLIKNGPEFDEARSDPRYHALMRKINLE